MVISGPQDKFLEIYLNRSLIMPGGDFKEASMMMASLSTNANFEGRMRRSASMNINESKVNKELASYCKNYFSDKNPNMK